MLVSDDVVDPRALPHNGRYRAHQFLGLVEKALAQQKTCLGECVSQSGDFAHSLLECQAFLRLLTQDYLLFLGGNSSAQSSPLLDIKIEGKPETKDQRGGDCARSGAGRLIAPHELLESIEITRRTGLNWF